MVVWFTWFNLVNCRYHFKLTTCLVWLNEILLLFIERELKLTLVSIRQFANRQKGHKLSPDYRLNLSSRYLTAQIPFFYRTRIILNDPLSRKATLSYLLSLFFVFSSQYTDCACAVSFTRRHHFCKFDTQSPKLESHLNMSL